MEIAIVATTESVWDCVSWHHQCSIHWNKNYQVREWWCHGYQILRPATWFPKWSICHPCKQNDVPKTMDCHTTANLEPSNQKRCKRSSENTVDPPRTTINDGYPTHSTIRGGPGCCRWPGHRVLGKLHRTNCQRWTSTTLVVWCRWISNRKDVWNSEGAYSDEGRIDWLLDQQGMLRRCHRWWLVRRSWFRLATEV